MDSRIYRLSDEYSLFKGDFKEQQCRLFNISEGTIYKLNEVSYDMLSLFDGKKNVAGVLKELKKVYNVEEEILKRDLLKMLKEWVDIKILIEKE